MKPVMKLLVVVLLSTLWHQVSGVAGGHDAQSSRYPYFARLSVGVDEGIFFCGATLIHKDILMTAAHCSIDAIEMTAEISATRLEDGGIPREIDFESMTPHPDFMRIKEDHDIMLLRLKSPVDEVTPVNLNRNRQVPRNGDDVWTVGLGLLAAIGFRDPSILQQVEIQVVPHATCNSPNSYSGTVDNDLAICAGDVASGGKDACYGDGGGPLIRALGPGNDLQVGVVSSGDGCGNPDFPGKYTRVSTYVDWIDATICSLSEYPPAGCASAPAAFCFSSTTIVRTKKKGLIQMSDLEIGDYVHTSTSSSGKPVYDQVYSFGHSHATLKAEFLQIHSTASSKKSSKLAPLEISSNHLLYIVDHIGERRAVPASRVKVGDEVVLVGENGVDTTVVTEVHTVTRPGVYAPFTYSGTIAVNGLLASTFVGFQQDADHFMVGDFRTPFSFDMLGYVFEAPHRITSRLFRNQLVETYSVTGVSSWVDVPLKVTEWAVAKQTDILSQLVLIIMMATCFLAYMVESLALSPTALVTLVATIIVGLYVRPLRSKL